MSKHDDIVWEIDFYEGLVVHLPDCIDVLKPLGDNYTQIGRIEEGLAIDLKLVRLLPDDPTVHYNLACSLSLLDNADGAIFALRRAVELGYREIGWMRSDPDLENLRSDPRYPAIEQSLRAANAVPHEPHS